MLSGGRHADQSVEVIEKTLVRLLGPLVDCEAVVDGTEQLEQRATQLYRKHGAMLRALMQRRFAIPRSESEALLHEVFLAFLSSSDVIRQERAWLVGAACHMSRYYWRCRAKEEEVPMEFEPEPVSAGVEGRIEIEQILDRLPENAQEILRLHYLEGLSGPELAERFGTSPGYAHVLIHRSLEKARELLGSRAS